MPMRKRDGGLGASLITPGTTTVGAIATWGNTSGTQLLNNPGITVGAGGALQTAGVGNGAVVGNARATGATDLQTIRTAATQVASGLNAILIGANSTAAGANSIALGNGANAAGSSAISIGLNTSASPNCTAIGHTATASPDGALAYGYVVSATANRSMALGWAGTATRSGEFAFSSSNFTGFVSPTRQSISALMTMNRQTTDAIPTEMVNPSRVILADDTSVAFEILVVARRTDADNESAAYQFTGCIDRNTGAATTALVGTVTKTVIVEDTAAWDVNVDADTTNGALRITVTGENSKTIRWCAQVWTVEITG